PHPLVQTAEDQMVRVLQACFESAPDRDAGMRSVPGADDAAFEQGIEKSGPLAAGNGGEALARFRQLRDESGGRLARVALPETLRSGNGIGRGERFSKSDMLCEQLPRPGLPGAHQLEERPGDLTEALDPSLQLPCLVGSFRVIGLVLPGTRGQCGREAAEAAARAGAAKDRELEPPHPAPE